MTVIGARPQFVKAAVVSRALPEFKRNKAASSPFREVIVHTGQHYDDGMSSVFFRELEIPQPAHHLGVGSGPHGEQTGRMLERLERVMQQERPTCVLVYGDTNSTLAGALAAAKLGIPVAHVEAGLRSYRRTMPEETNRVVTDHLSTWLFCPTSRAVKNLSCEGITKGVHLVGDVMYDSLRYNLERAAQMRLSESLVMPSKSYALATVHRAETTDDPAALQRVFKGLGSLGMPVVVPLHPRTKAAIERAGISLAWSVKPIAPVSYLEMLSLARTARLILTDSGGLQKEAFWLHVPCVTLREETEWVETVELGANHLAGTDPERIVASASEAVKSGVRGDVRPYGDGRSAELILEILWELERIL
jgi:UDP-GlcNAc3NAcA epimerase